MKKNIVILALEDYNELMDVNKAVLDKKKILISHRYNESMDTAYLFADNEDFEKALILENENLRENNSFLKTRIDNLNRELVDIKKAEKLSIEEIKKMNWIQFRKWKNQ